MTDTPTFGARCAEALKVAKRANPNLSWTEIAAIIQAQHDQHNDLRLESDVPATTPRVTKKDQQGALFDALVLACGMTTAEMTRSARGATGSALSEIRAATPDVTPEEIARRAKLYRQRHRDWTLTPRALCTHWAEFGQGDKTATAKRDIYQEPPRWREIIRERGMPGWSDETIENMIARQWADIRAAFGPEILSRIQ